MLMSTSRTARCDTAEAELWNATSSPPPVTGLMSDVLQLIAPQVKTSPGKRNLRFTESPNLQSRVPLSSGENWAGSKVADSCLACYLNCSCGCGLCRDLGSVTAIFKNACIKNEPVNASATIKNNFCVAIFEGTTHVFMGPSVNFCLWSRLNFSFTFGWLTPTTLADRLPLGGAEAGKTTPAGRCCPTVQTRTSHPSQRGCVHLSLLRRKWASGQSWSNLAPQTRAETTQQRAR